MIFFLVPKQIARGITEVTLASCASNPISSFPEEDQIHECTDLYFAYNSHSSQSSFCLLICRLEIMIMPTCQALSEAHS